MKTRIKICGLTREEDVEAAVAAGADALGFVFYPASPRYVTPQRAAELVRRVPPFVEIVGLFVNEARRYVAESKSRLAALRDWALPLAPTWVHGTWSAESQEKLGRKIEPAPWAACCKESSETVAPG